MVCLTETEFATLHDAVTEYWQPLVVFLVAAGARWSVAVTVKPGDVNRDGGIVRDHKGVEHR